MNRNSINYLTAALTFMFCPLSAAKEACKWQVMMGGEYGAYDRSDYLYQGVSFGVVYNTDCGTHALLLAIGDLADYNERAVSYPDIDAISFSYRYSYPVSSRFDLFAECGVERLSWSVDTHDVIGTPISFGSSDISYFIGLGVKTRLYKQFYVTASVRYYLSDNEVFETSALGVDIFGSPEIVKKEAPDLMAKIGLTWEF